jgi:hypothetical protein
MLRAPADDALGEDALMVWLDMIYAANGGSIEALEKGLDPREHLQIYETPNSDL